MDRRVLAVLLYEGLGAAVDVQVGGHSCRTKLTAARASEAVMSGRDSPNGKLGLAQVILTGCQGIPKSLPDDVLKVRVHGGMRALSAAKEKPRRFSYSATSAMASRWSRRSVLTASRARHRSAGDMVIAALASALVTP